MPVPIRVLVIEDNPDDAELMVLELSRGGFAPEWRRVETAEDLRTSLVEQTWDVVVSDYSVPGFGGMQALQLLHSVRPNVPFIVVSGTIGEESAVAMMRAGASDYLLKGNLARLAPAVERELREAADRQARWEAEQTMRRLAAMVDSSTDAIFCETLDGIVTEWNPAAERLYGWSAAEAIGQHFAFFVPIELHAELAAMYEQIRSGQLVESTETVRLHRDGTRIDVAVTLSPVCDREGRLVGISKITRDIRERKRTEAALKASERRLRQTLDATQVGEWDLDLATGVTHCSAIHDRIFGAERPFTEWSLARFLEFVHPLDRERVAGYFQLADPTEQGWECRILRLDGQERWIWVKGTVLQWSEGRPARISGLVMDITERKVAEQRLAESNRRFEETLEAVSDLFVAFDKDWNYTYLNRQAAAFTGCKPADLVGKNIWDEFPEAQNGPFHHEMVEAARSGNIRRFEAFYPELGLWYEHRAYPHPQGMSLFSTDFTEQKRAARSLKESEERYRLLFESNPHPMWVYDLKTLCFLAVNDTAVRQYGYSRDEFLGMTLKDIRPPEDLPRLMASLAALTSNPTLSNRWRHSKKDGSLIDVEISSSDFQYQNQPARLVLALDVTDRLRAEAEAQRTATLLKAVSDGTSDAVFVKDRESRYLLVNPAMARFMGRRIEDILGQDDFEFFSPEDAGRIKKTDYQVMESGEVITRADQLMIAGVSRTFMTTKAPYLDAKRNIAGVIGVARDITEQKLAADALRESEERYRAVVEDQTEVVCRLQADRTFAFVNGGFCRLVGKTPGELLGLQGPSITHPEDVPLVEAALATLSPGNPVVRVENRVVDTAGGIRWMEFINRGFFDPAGKLVELQAVGRDITERRQAEEALREKEGKLAEAVQIARMGYWSRDLASGELTWSDELHGIFGVKPAEFGRTLEAFLAIIHPEDRDRVRQRINEAEAAGESFDHTYRILVRGEVRVIHAVARVLLGEDSKPQRYTGTAQDVTERARTEEALARDALLLANVQDSVMVTDLNGIVTYWNEGSTRMFGWTAEEMLGQPMTSRVPPNAREHVIRTMDAIRQGQEFSGEWEDYRKDGSRIWIHARTSLIHDRSGIPIGLMGVAQDISSRKRAESALLEGERRFRETLERIPLIAVWLNQQGKITFANDALLSLLGYTHEEVLDQDWFANFLPPDVAPGIRKRFEEGLPRGHIFPRYENEVLTRSGERRLVAWNNTVLRDPEGRAIGTSSLGEDVTQRRRAEEALRLRDRAIGTATQGIVITDPNRPDNPMIYASPGFERLTGYSQAEVLGRNCRFLQGEKTAPWAVAQVREAIHTGQPCTVELINYRKDGSTFWNELSISPVRDDQGKLTHFVGVQADVSERRQLQEERDQLLRRLQFQFERMPVGCLVMDPDLRLLDWNPAAERIFGYTREQVLGRTCMDLGIILTAERPAVESALQQLLNGDSALQSASENLTRDGRAISCEWYYSPLGSRSGLLAMVLDVTEKRSLEDKLRQAQKMEAIGQLAGGIAHDFNNLLTIISGYSDLLLQRMPESDLDRALVQEIHRAGARSAALTRQLLVFSRKQVVQPRVLDLNEVVTEAEKLLRRVIGEDVRLEVNLRPLAGQVRIDPGQLEQVLLNLAVNARDAMPTGGRLTIETGEVELDESYARLHAGVKPGRYVLMAVTDTGCGMSPQVIARIFEPFFTTKEAGKGTGLGLAVVHGVVQEAGGHVGVYSEVGIGTSFKVYLPRVEQGSRTVKSLLDLKPPPRGSETVLLVEDEDEVRSLIRHILVGCGYHVLEAEEGHKALQIARTYQEPIHLLVTDVVMPGGLGGRQVAEQVVAWHTNVKVLYVSGYTDDAVVRHGVLGEEVHFMQKPFSPLALAHKVRQILDSPAGPRVP